jgi:DNA invertase Pin-like site-specific DNA recombinase
MSPLVQARKIDAVLVTELTRWGRSTIDLINTLRVLEDRGVSLVAQSGLEFNLSTPQGKLIATLMAGLAEFERDLIRERVRSGIAAAKARGIRFGRLPGQTTKGVLAKTKQVLKMSGEGESYRTIAKRLKMSKNTVMKIVRQSKESSGLPETTVSPNSKTSVSA